MLQPADAVPRAPAEFAANLATKEPVILVGGQAVNLWALVYADYTKDLAPFTSRDADVLGDATILEELGKLAGEKPVIFPLRPPTNEVGVVIAKAPDGAPMLIEVLRYVKGATNEELTDPLYRMGLGSKQVPVQVPGPIVLLQAKLANVAGLSQTGRQDARHVAILARVLPAYFSQIQIAVREGRQDERALINLLERLLGIVIEPQNAKILAELSVDRRHLFASLDPGFPRVKSFLEQRLPRVLTT